MYFVKLFHNSMKEYIESLIRNNSANIDEEDGESRRTIFVLNQCILG